MVFHLKLLSRAQDLVSISRQRCWSGRAFCWGSLCWQCSGILPLGVDQDDASGHASQLDRKLASLVT